MPTKVFTDIRPFRESIEGGIPRCVFPAMATDESINDQSYMAFLTIKESLSIYLSRKYLFGLRFKGMELFFSGSLYKYIYVIDLSSNHLTQGIPIEITKLVYLRALNLSRNQLVGSIPSNIGELKNLEALDLSRNQLSCVISTTMVTLNFLSFLNLSYNTLSGKIPSDGQFAIFDNDCYIGNPHLCGDPLTEACLKNSSFKYANCSHIEEHENDNYGDKRRGLVINPFYITLIVGFFTGFWVFWGSILLFASWRHAYFCFLSNMEDKSYVNVVVTINKLRRKLHTQQPPM
ncbi:unnamed protein product [Vicia faba]|uniref:Uncharacterized protein n=1 Tax=Vicia faba TaxID=3906 RepID=A0AAV1BBK7_VICFA|nr:unnamed protein product [Vicia faba]